MTKEKAYTEDGHELPSDGIRPLALNLRWLTPEQTDAGRWYNVKESLPYIAECPHQEFSGPGGYDRPDRGDVHVCNRRASRDVLVKYYDGRTKKVMFLTRSHGVSVGSGAMTTSYSWYPGGLPVCNSLAWMELPE